MNKTEKLIVEIFTGLATCLILFWVFKAIVTVATIGYVGMMISEPIVYLWDTLFRAIGSETCRNIFCNFCQLDFPNATTIELATSYFRLGLLEMPAVVWIYGIFVASAKLKAINSGHDEISD